MIGSAICKTPLETSTPGVGANIPLPPSTSIPFVPGTNCVPRMPGLVTFPFASVVCVPPMKVEPPGTVYGWVGAGLNASGSLVVSGGGVVGALGAAGALGAVGYALTGDVAGCVVGAVGVGAGFATGCVVLVACRGLVELCVLVGSVMELMSILLSRKDFER